MSSTTAAVPSAPRRDRDGHSVEGRYPADSGVLPPATSDPGEDEGGEQPRQARRARAPPTSRALLHRARRARSPWPRQVGPRRAQVGCAAARATRAGCAVARRSGAADQQRTTAPEARHGRGPGVQIGPPPPPELSAAGRAPPRRSPSPPPRQHRPLTISTAEPPPATGAPARLHDRRERPRDTMSRRPLHRRRPA
jgi:hypothetical protein